MKMISHDSTAVHSSGHDGKSTMQIRFQSGHTYEAADVTPEQHAAFVAAASQGAHWHQNLKNAHNWTKTGS
jgi:hypothetical protein